MRERILGERRPMRKRRRTYIVAVALAALAAGLVFAMSAGGASLPGSNFEIDASANLKVDGAAPAIDWVSIPNTGVPNESRGQDTASGQNDSSYKGGEKEDDPCPTAGTGSIPNNKSDLKTFGAYVEPEPGGPGYLHLFWRRVNDPSGTTLMDFELNKNSADCDGAGPGINAARTQGDILLEYSIDQGGAQANVTARIWNW